MFYWLTVKQLNRPSRYLPISIFLSLLVAILVSLFWKLAGVVEGRGAIFGQHLGSNWGQHFSLLFFGAYLGFALLYSISGYYFRFDNCFTRALKGDFLTYGLVVLVLFLELLFKLVGNFKVFINLFEILFVGGVFIKSAFFLKYLFTNLTAQSINVAKGVGVIFLATFLIYGLLVPVANTHWADGDELHYLIEAHSLAYDRDLNLYNNFKNRDYWGYRPTNMDWVLKNALSEKLYQIGEKGLSVLLIPGYILARRFGVSLEISLLAALLAANIYLLTLEVTKSLKASFYVWLFLAFTSPLLIFSSQAYPEIPGGLLIIYALRKIRLASQWKIGSALMAGTCLGFLPWLNTRFILPSAILFLFSLRIFTKNKKTIIAFILPIILFGFGLMSYNYRFFGSLMPGAGYLQNGTFNTQSLNLNVLIGGLGLLFDRGFGLIPYAPIYLLVLVGLPLALRENKKDLIVILATFSSLYLFLSATNWWYAGWSPPSRYLASIIPLLGPLVGFYILKCQKSLFRWTAYLLAALSFMISFIFTVMPSLRYSSYQAANSALFDFIKSISRVNLTYLVPSFIKIDISSWWLTAIYLVMIIAFSIYCYVWSSKATL